jgi:hypothetical protein
MTWRAFGECVETRTEEGTGALLGTALFVVPCETPSVLKMSALVLRPDHFTRLPGDAPHPSA